MRATRRVLLPVLAALIVGAFVGGGAAGAGTEPRVTTRTVTIPAAAFTPIYDDTDYSKGPADLHVTSGSGTFEAPIKKVVFYCVDAGAGNLILGLYRVQLAEDRTVLLGEVYSAGSGWTMQEVTLSGFSPRRITGAYGAVLNISLPGTYPQGYGFMGAKVTYSY
jgi:hypothetical protein